MYSDSEKLNRLVNVELKHLVSWLNADKIPLNVRVRKLRV